MSDNTCAICGGEGYEEFGEGHGFQVHPCYHCRTTGKCSCEECHPPVQQDWWLSHKEQCQLRMATEVADFTDADWEKITYVMGATRPQLDGWAVHVTVPRYDNRDALVGSHTFLAAIFTSENVAHAYADTNPDPDAQVKVSPCKFILETQE